MAHLARSAYSPRTVYCRRPDNESPRRRRSAVGRQRLFVALLLVVGAPHPRHPIVAAEAASSSSRGRWHCANAVCAVTGRVSESPLASNLGSIPGRASGSSRSARHRVPPPRPPSLSCIGRVAGPAGRRALAFTWMPSSPSSSSSSSLSAAENKALNAQPPPSSPSEDGDNGAMGSEDECQQQQGQQQRPHVNNMFHGALHQVEHRAKEKSAVKLGEKAAERLLERAAERGGERLLERGTERVGERLVERGAERAGERLLERGAERAGERLLEQGAERVGERLLERGAERASERLVERGAERVGERLSEQGTKKAGEHLLERGAKRMGERLVESGAERAGERLLEQGAERASERLLERGAERAGERLLERGAERASGAAAKGAKRSSIVGRVAAAHVAELGEHAGETGAVWIAGRHRLALKEMLSGRVAARVGRAASVLLPALGGFFALWLLRSDLRQIGEEWSRERSYRLHVEGGASSEAAAAIRPWHLPALLFGGAALVDGLDAMSHFVVAYAVLRKLGHAAVLRWEEISLACAVLSTVLAVAGELCAYRRARKRRDEADAAAEAEPS